MALICGHNIAVGTKIVWRGRSPAGVPRWFLPLPESDWKLARNGFYDSERLMNQKQLDKLLAAGAIKQADKWTYEVITV